MAELSLSYYASMCKGNAELLETFKALLLKDFKSMDASFFSAAEENNLPAMRSELHKMYPIAFNLNFSQMVDLIEKYRHCRDDEFTNLHAELKMCLTKIYDLLKADWSVFFWVDILLDFAERSHERMELAWAIAQFANANLQVENMGAAWLVRATGVH